MIFAKRASAKVCVLKKHLYILPSMLVVMVVCGWFATAGTWKFIEVEMLSNFYDAQADSLIDGRLDVPCKVISGEAFVYNNKCYGYFGITPALFRFLANSVAPEYRGKWGRVSVFIAVFLNILVGYFFLVFTRVTDHGLKLSTKLVYSLFIITIGIGSTNVFLTSPAFIYHEAIIWGVALALAAYALISLFAITGSVTALWMCVFTIFLALNARLNTGLAPSILLLTIIGSVSIIDVKKDRPNSLEFAMISLIHYFRVNLSMPGRLRVMILVLVIGSMLMPFALNHLKFKSYGAVPLQYHVQLSNNPERLARTVGNILQPSNVSFILYHYFSPLSVSLTSDPPWFAMGQYDWHLSQFPRAKLDNLEPVVSLPDTSSALMILSLIGVMAAFAKDSAYAKFRLTLLASLLGGALILFVAALSHRYTHEFYPFLVIAAAIGLNRLVSIDGRRLKRGLIILFLITLSISVYINIGTAFLHNFVRPEVRSVPVLWYSQVSGSDLYLPLIVSGCLAGAIVVVVFARVVPRTKVKLTSRQSQGGRKPNA